MTEDANRLTIGDGARDARGVVPSSSDRVRGMLPLSLLALAQAKGAPEGEVRRAVGLAPDAVLGLDDAAPLSLALALWRQLLLRFPSDPLGLELADSWRTESLGLIGYLAANASTLGEALERFVQLQALVDGEERMTYAVRGEALVISFEPDPRLSALRQPMEALVASGHAYCQRLLGERLTARAVSFAHPCSLGLAPYRAFFGVTPRFEADRYQLRYEARVLALPIPGADPQLARYLEPAAEAERERWLARDAVERAARVIRERLGARREVSIEDCARAMGMSARALQRELAAESTSFRRVADRERRRVAEILLTAPSTPIAEVARAVGYSELASFSRAFKRWTSYSPGEFRQRAS